VGIGGESLKSRAEVVVEFEVVAVVVEGSIAW
jgi:hypothetical protein